MGDAPRAFRCDCAWVIPKIIGLDKAAPMTEVNEGLIVERRDDVVSISVPTSASKHGPIGRLPGVVAKKERTVSADVLIPGLGIHRGLARGIFAPNVDVGSWIVPLVASLNRANLYPRR